MSGRKFLYDNKKGSGTEPTVISNAIWEKTVTLNVSLLSIWHFHKGYSYANVFTLPSYAEKTIDTKNCRKRLKKKNTNICKLLNQFLMWHDFISLK